MGGPCVCCTTDAEWLGAELNKTLATELLKSRQRSGQRGYVVVEAEGQPTEEPPADTRPDVSQILGAVVPAPSVLAPIPEEGDSMDTTTPEIAESSPGIRPRQPESEPGSEPVDRNVRPRLAPDQEVPRLHELENSESTTQIREDVGQTPDEVHVDNPPDAASSILSPFPLISASNNLTVLPVEAEFDLKAQAVVHGSVDAVTGQDSTTFEAIEGMAVFDSENTSFLGSTLTEYKSGVASCCLNDEPNMHTSLGRHPVLKEITCAAHLLTVEGDGESVAHESDADPSDLTNWQDALGITGERFILDIHVHTEPAQEKG